MITVKAKIRGQGQYYSNRSEILFIAAKKSECPSIKVANGVRRPIRLRIGRDTFQAGIRTTAKMPIIWVCTDLLDSLGEKVSLAEALKRGRFRKNQSVILKVQAELMEIVAE